MSGSAVEFTVRLARASGWRRRAHLKSFRSPLLHPRDLCRRQCDAQASVERLYKRLHPEFIEWEDVQLTRLTVLERVEKATTTKQKFDLLSDALVISLHSVTPPDRVGVIRR